MPYNMFCPFMYEHVGFLVPQIFLSLRVLRHLLKTGNVTFTVKCCFPEGTDHMIVYNRRELDYTGGEWLKKFLGMS